MILCNNLAKREVGWNLETCRNEKESERANSSKYSASGYA